MSCQACKIDRGHLGGFNYGHIKLSDMPDEMRSEVKEAVVTAIEKFPDNYEGASKMVKEMMDKKFGTYWHCIMGEGFGFEITYELKHLMYMYFGGYIAVLVFKAL
uniref:Dynein light chain n=1 Tax=Eutreptiella gymnastica TaxID=73025 RepID=A0A7S4FGT2_9EUGL|mmetsp:Transcript_38370/g.63759  ORF Transcript_38370/g.63759 Transcript_38370/m.63759 type:complete len:105 (+) Transcript_38370:88-402(+)|eukprot:CAMPEP_0174284544 /NCGR_PEP_ID=MMETSP0809-20121228/5847_1 /TAXON_ID=73025 ORGANISM="Eutreptiella gymnastica-like, Strain CCMP1594" /NCGR_SAMPLE_ID=MMETSP0809 /ASSEMBLY_ACC=CAM_ASM_000658 /LENGTH=104 /DNA_ID=CAMNT_0015380081 /DNA_START=63 /DNA_END=377 /DNA_ORIENTATION=-